MENIVIKTDPLSGETFKPKRINQKFASSANRIKYNNNLANSLRQERNVINIPLNKTHRLVKKLMQGKDEAIFSDDYLSGYGVQFNSFNHFTSVQGNKLPCIFEFAFLKAKNSNQTKIIRYGRF